jgi:hypothetical protein
MVHDSISGNPNMLPPDSASFFKGYILLQDEVRIKFEQQAHGVGYVKEQKSESNRLVQAKLNDSGRYCTSVFIPHNLTPTLKGPIEKPVIQTDWVFGFLVLCLIILVSIRAFFYRRFIQVFKAFLTQRYLNQLMREGNILSERITPPMVIIQMISISLFLFQTIKLSVGLPQIGYNDIILFLVLLVATAAFYGFRLLLMRIIGWIFNTREQSQAYVVNTMIFNEVCGITLIPFSFLIYYLPPHLAYILSLITLGIFGAIIIYKFIRGFIIGLSVTNFSWLYLFLYLCTVEILPVLVLGKLTISYFKILS